MPPPSIHVAALRNVAFGQLRGELRFGTFAENGQRDGGAFRVAPDELRELIGFGQDLVVEHLQDVIGLNAGRGRRPIGNDVVHDKAEALGQAELLRDHRRHFRGFHAQKSNRNFR